VSDDNDFMQQEDIHARSRDLGSFMYLLRFAQADAWHVALSLTLLVSAGVTGVFSAWSLGHLIELIKANTHKGTAQTAALIIALELSGVTVAYWGRRILAHSASNTIFRIRQELFRHLNLLPMSYFDRQPLGRVVTRLTYDVNNIEDFFIGTLARLLTAGISIVTVLTGMFVADLRLGLTLAVTIVPAVVVTYWVRGSVRYWNREFAHRNSTINARLSEFLNGIPVIRSFGAENWSQRIFDDTVDHHLHAAIKMNVLNAWSRPLILGLCYLPLLVLLWFGGQRVLAGTLSLGLFVTFVRFCERFSKPISALAQEIHTVQTAFANADRVANFLKQDTETKVLGEEGPVQASNLKGEIEFQDVSMSYNGRELVLENLSFHVRPGERIGLAGRTGSGKTTTLGLLARLYEFQEGRILIDRNDIRQFNRSSLRGQIGYVSQDVVIFKGSIRENLSFGERIPDSVLRESCERTGLGRVLATRELTLDSELLDQGANLSHGERQLLALTRVLIKNPALLVMDEATANIDPGFERLVHQAVDSIMKERTCFIIAHRLATLRSCDRIFVFKAGRLCEHGRHDELLAQGGYYAELIRSGNEASMSQGPLTQA
jgi:ABC-type multidrug transport system fused ATPase/permease subunit